MNTGKDDEMWQRIEDAFTPNVAEMRRSEKDISRMRVVEDSGVEHSRVAGGRVAGGRVEGDNAAASHRATTAAKPARMRRATLTATILLLAVGLGWIGKSIVYYQTYDRLTTLDLAVASLAEPDTERSWVSSMFFATKRIQVGLYALQAMAKSESGTSVVVTAAQEAWDRLRAGNPEAVGDGSFDIELMLDAALSQETPAAEKLRTINNLEGLLSRLIPAARNAHPARLDTKAMATWNILHWLDDASQKPPAYVGDEIKAANSR